MSRITIHTYSAGLSAVSQHNICGYSDTSCGPPCRVKFRTLWTSCGSPCRVCKILYLYDGRQELACLNNFCVSCGDSLCKITLQYRPAYKKHVAIGLRLKTLFYPGRQRAVYAMRNSNIQRRCVERISPIS